MSIVNPVAKCVHIGRTTGHNTLIDERKLENVRAFWHNHKLNGSFVSLTGIHV